MKKHSIVVTAAALGVAVSLAFLGNVGYAQDKPAASPPATGGTPIILPRADFHYPGKLPADHEGLELHRAPVSAAS
jgi:hypothetical protein